MVFISHAFALVMLVILAVVGKIDGLLWLALGGAAACLAVDAIMWLRVLASSFNDIFTDKVAVQVAPPTPAALPVPDAVPSNKASE